MRSCRKVSKFKQPQLTQLSAFPFSKLNGFLYSAKLTCSLKFEDYSGPLMLVSTNFQQLQLTAFCFLFHFRASSTVRPVWPLPYWILRGKMVSLGFWLACMYLPPNFSPSFSLRLQAYKAATRGLTFHQSWFQVMSIFQGSERDQHTRNADGTNAWNQWIRVMATLKQQNVHIQTFHVESLSCDMVTETTKLWLVD